MKGSLVHAIIASLDERARKKFIASRAAVKDREQLVQLFRFLAEQEVYSETELLKLIGQTKRQKNSQVEHLGHQLMAFLGEGKPDVIVFQVLASAPRLIENQQDRQAIELIEWGIALAEETENYHAIQSLWRLAELFPDRPKFRGMSYDHALACGANLLAYRQMEVRLRQMQTIDDFQERQSAIEEVEASPLLDSPGMALGFEARLLYWRIKAICKYLTNRYKDAIAPQMAMVEMLKERRDGNLDIEQRWIKEMGSLAALYVGAGEYEKPQEIWDEILYYPTDFHILQCEKTRQIYPARIAIALDFSGEYGDQVCRQVLAMIAERKEWFSPGLQCKTLFYCASYYIAADCPEDASRLLLKLRSYSRPSFSSNIYSMTKLLEIILEIDREAFDDAIRLIKNLKMSKYNQAIAGFGSAIQLLSAVTLMLSEPNGSWKQIPNQPTVRKLAALLEGQPVLMYFNLLAWVKARSTGNPMLHSSRHRVSE